MGSRDAARTKLLGEIPRKTPIVHVQAMPIIHKIDTTMNIEEQVLSREQMAHLVELGVDTSDASMMWYRCDDGNTERWYLQINNELSQGVANVMNRVSDFFVPTYTIGDLIEKLPKDIDLGELIIRWDNRRIGYGYWVHNELVNMEPWRINFREQSIRDALYDCLCWIAENHKELIK